MILITKKLICLLLASLFHCAAHSVNGGIDCAIDYKVHMLRSFENVDLLRLTTPLIRSNGVETNAFTDNCSF